MSHYTVSIRPSTGGLRKFAVTTQEPVCAEDWCSGEISCQSDQTWEAKVWQRITDRGYVCRLEGGGQWSNRGDHGVYIGVGASAEGAMRAAWAEAQGDDDNFDPPRCILAAMRDYDATVHPVETE